MARKEKDADRKYGREYTQEYRWWRKKYHLCITCKGQDAFTLAGRQQCAECSAKRKEYDRKYLLAKPEKGEAHKARQAELRAERRARHECTACGRPLAAGYVYGTCEWCRAKSRQKHEQERARSCVVTKGEWDELGLCVRCGQPRMEGGASWSLSGETKLCARCYKDSVSALVKGRASHVEKHGMSWGAMRYGYERLERPSEVGGES